MLKTVFNRIRVSTNLRLESVPRRIFIAIGSLLEDILNKTKKTAFPVIVAKLCRIVNIQRRISDCCNMQDGVLCGDS